MGFTLWIVLSVGAGVFFGFLLGYLWRDRHTGREVAARLKDDFQSLNELQQRLEITDRKSEQLTNLYPELIRQDATDQLSEVTKAQGLIKRLLGEGRAAEAESLQRETERRLLSALVSVELWRQVAAFQSAVTKPIIELVEATERQTALTAGLAARFKDDADHAELVAEINRLVIGIRAHATVVRDNPFDAIERTLAQLSRLNELTSQLPAEDAN